MQRRHKTNSRFTFRRSRESDAAGYGALVEVIGGPHTVLPMYLFAPGCEVLLSTGCYRQLPTGGLDG